jgi:Zn-dependent protease with chaperone function
MEAFFIESPMVGRMSALFSTHPSVDQRVEALRRYAGAAQDYQSRLLQGP